MEPQLPETTPVPAQPIEPPKPKKNSFLIVLLSILLLLATSLAFFFTLQTQKLAKQLAQIQTSASPTPTPLSTEAPAKVDDETTNWKTYKNEQYGFEFSYPSAYKVLTDKENLYGWPKAILLLYKGGQSYDMPVEVWNNEAEYKQKYNSAFDVAVFQKNGKFITLLNANKDPEVAGIVSTFKFTN